MSRAVVYGMSSAEYHALPDIGNSGLSAIAQSPAHYHALYLAEDRPARVETQAFSAGTLAHAVILEPESVGVRYAVKPEGHDGRTKDGKAWAEANVGKTIVALDAMDTAQRQRAAILAVPDLAAMFASGRAEVSAFWEENGVQCKCRPDWVHPRTSNSVILLDVKTARDATPEGFARAVAAYGYHRQAAWYTRGFEKASGLRVEAFVFAVVPSAYPFVAGAYVLDDESMQQGADECTGLLSIYANCAATNTWPGYGTGLQLISLPAWAKATSEVEVSYA